MGGATTMSFLSLTNTIPIVGAFYLYASIAAPGWVFMYFFLLEMMGKSLEDTGKLFGKDMDEDVDDGAAVRHERRKSTELTSAPH
jgi:hypothetical protein